MSKKSFDSKIFTRLISFVKPYNKRFWIATLSTILLAVVSSGIPYVLMKAVNDFTETKDLDRLLYFSVAMLLLLLIQVLLQFIFIYNSNWVGQNVIKDIRLKVFRKIISFKKSYFDKNAVGRLVTRVVSDVETISNFFAQGVFVIVADILKMIVIMLLMLFIKWQLALIVFICLPILVYATKLFQKAIKSTFEDVRNQVANLNGFVQERITGMKIVQLFNREEIEYDKFKEINEKHKKANIKTIWYYSIFFPVTDIISAVAIGLIVWYGGLQVISGNYMTVGEIVGFIKMCQMLFRPLRHIADKFNQLQMGIVAGKRVFDVLDTKYSIQKEGTISAKNIKGNVCFKDVHFSYYK